MKGYDAKCLELAEFFLLDEAVPPEDLGLASEKLALRIQQTIEDFIEELPTESAESAGSGA